MTSTFVLSTFLRQTPKALLKRYFDARGLLRDIAFEGGGVRTLQLTSAGKPTGPRTAHPPRIDLWGARHLDMNRVGAPRYLHVDGADFGLFIDLLAEASRRQGSRSHA